MKSPLTYCIILLALQACGGGSGGGGSADAPTSASKYLSWTIPATRIDGSHLPLNSIAGYRIYYGTSENNLQPLLDIDDSTIDEYSFTISNLGFYYFGISVYDVYGLESEISTLVRK